MTQEQIINELTSIRAAAQLLFDQATRLEKRVKGVYSKPAPKGLTHEQIQKALAKRRKTELR
jgi:hypothetical protein